MKKYQTILKLLFLFKSKIIIIAFYPNFAFLDIKIRFVISKLKKYQTV